MNAIDTRYIIARGVFATYGYFVIDPRTNHGFLIDPGAQPELFLQSIAENGWSIERILLTHGHFDHMGAAAQLRDRLGVPVMAHAESDKYLLDPEMNLSAENGLDIILPDTLKFHGGDDVRLEANPDAALKIVHMPGHTDDSVGFYNERAGVVYVGDTIYQGGPGLTIFPTGNAARLRHSIEDKILTLPEETVLCSGHAAPITVSDLRRNL